MTQDSNDHRSLTELRAAADRARAAFDWELAQALYAEALERTASAEPETFYALLDDRAECHRHLGSFPAQAADLEAMVRLAEEMGDPVRQIEAVSRLADLRIWQGELAEARHLAETALAKARERQDRKLEADSLAVLGNVCLRAGEAAQGKEHAGGALDLYRGLGDEAGQARCHYLLSLATHRFGYPSDGAAHIQTALDIHRRLGDREGEGDMLNVLGAVATDSARQWDYYRRARAAFEAVGHRPRQARIDNNLALLYWRLGLYGRAREHAERAVAAGREMGAGYELAYFLDGLARTLLVLGDHDRAQELFQEGLELCQETGDPWAEVAYWRGLGQNALAQGRAAEARDSLQKAAELAGEINAQEDQASALAWLGAAHLAVEDVDSARGCTARAVAIQEAASGVSDYAAQEVWWWRYQALVARPSPSGGGFEGQAPPPSPDGRGVGGEGENAAWQALEQAREVMMERIAALSDDGLRRNYFQRVEINRQIIEAWLSEASRRGLPLTPLAEHVRGEGDPEGQLQRMLEAVVRLNAKPEATGLPALILDEVVELTGAGRSAIFLLDDQGERWLAAESAIPTAEATDTQDEAWPEGIGSLLDEVTLKRALLLRYVPEDAAELEQRSVLCVPLVVQDRLVGLVYADLAGAYGRFADGDRDLLSVLANQAAVAVENARWTDTLEQRVAERTAELETVNSVQHALAQQLDFQAIIDLVGDKIQETFGSDSTGINLYDRQAKVIEPRYTLERGLRLKSEPFGLGEGLTSRVIDSRRPVVIGTQQEGVELGARMVPMDPSKPDEELTESYLGVPILAGNAVIGVVDVQSYQQHAFSESDARLLSTLAASMGVALENARLYEETNRLLAETHQRNAELAVLNSVQQGLARKIEFQAIIDLVADQVGETFTADSTMVALYDRETGLLHFPYMVEGEHRFQPDAYPLGPGLTSRVIESCQPLVLGTVQEQEDLGAVVTYIDPDDPDEPWIQSWLGVPLIVGEQATGVIAIMNYQEHAYDEADVRLLSTLAASMGVALENARLFEETNRLLAETQQRNAELAVINSVQQGLVAELEMQAIYDLVGDQIRDTFDAQSVLLGMYDHEAEQMIPHYLFEKGKRHYLAPWPFNELHRHLIRSRQVVRVDEGFERAMVEFGLHIPPGTEMPLSALFVPLVASGQVKGLVSLQNVDHEHAFSPDDVRLLTTLANTMSVALESARLFEETQQRNAELAVINSVQQGLARQLDFHGIIDLVGDQVREIFHGESTYIALYDRGTNLVRFPYFVGSKGQPVEAEPVGLGSGLTSIVIESRQPLVLGTLQQMVDLGAYVIKDESGKTQESFMGVPIRVGDEVTGVVAVQDWPQNRYREADVRLLSTLAASMGVALQNARLFEETNRLLDETQQRSAELAIISSVQQGLAQKLEFQAIIDLVGDRVRETFAGDSTLVALYDRENGLLHFPYMVEGEHRYQPDCYPLGPGLTSRVIETCQPLLLGTLQEQQDLGVVATYVNPDDPDERPPRSWLGVPLIVGEQATGVIAVQSYRENAYDESDVRLLGTLASSMGVALENARLFEETNRLLAETQQRNAELAIINEVGQALARQLEAGAIAELVGAKAGELFSADATSVVLYDRETGLVHLPYVAEGDHRFSIEPYPLGPGLNSRVIETRQPLLVGTRQELQELGPISYQIDPDEPDEQDIQSWLGVPLIAGEEATGVLNVQSYRPNAFDQADVRLLDTIAANAGVALENARLFAETNRLLEESRQRAAEMATVNRISQALASELELNALIELVGEQVRHTFQADIGYVALLDPQAKVIHFPYGYGDEFPSLRLGEGVTSRILQTGEPVLINEDVLGRYAEMGIKHVGTPSRSYLGVPIPVGREVIGVISVQSTKKTGRFGHDDVRLLSTIAANVGAAIQNARLFAEVEGQKQYSESIVSTSPVAIVTVDGEGRVLTWNPAAERLFGYPEAEAIGQDLDSLITTPEMAEEAAELARQTLSGSSVRTVSRRRTRDGQLLDVELMSVPVDAGTPDATYITIYHNITELKQTEKELQAAKEAAEAATQAKSAFLATMSHEIRTPMNAVIGMTSLLLDTELTPEQQEFAETIRSSGDALLTIINDILDFSKIEAGRIDLDRQPFDLRECVEGAVGLMAPTAAEKGLELGSLVDAGVPPAITGDETRLRQILLNLLSNAVKFTDEGEVLLTVTMDGGPEPQDAGALGLRFSVRDTGIGIPPDRVDRLFQSFSQVDSSTTRRYGGTGLGLAISKRLTELMGGTMWVESPAAPPKAGPGEREGRGGPSLGGPGSTFHFTIQAEQAEAPVREYLRTAQADLRDKRVLIVDDSATSRRILTLQMEVWGMVTQATGSPFEALDWIGQGDPFDLAVVDRQMPQMDGLMLAAEIRKHRDAGSLPLVMVSSVGRGEAGVDEGRVSAFLLKPIRASQLYNTLLGILAPSETTATLEEPRSEREFDREMGKRLPLRILLAEDNVVNQKLAQRLLQRLGYRADVAANGMEAIQALRRQTYDVVLMDVQMPEMDGLEATRAVRQEWPAAKRPRIIALTANVMKEDREACFAAGMDDYLGKPIRVDELISALSKCQALD